MTPGRHRRAREALAARKAAGLPPPTEWEQVQPLLLIGAVMAGLFVLGLIESWVRGGV